MNSSRVTDAELHSWIESLAIPSSSPDWKTYAWALKKIEEHPQMTSQAKVEKLCVLLDLRPAQLRAMYEARSRALSGDGIAFSAKCSPAKTGPGSFCDIQRERA
ncbi:MAG TPA: hypothetical protein VGM44_25205 [Polyangiaceae bacterium]|jgi:hypothetical protein